MRDSVTIWVLSHGWVQAFDFADDGVSVTSVTKRNLLKLSRPHRQRDSFLSL